MPLVGVSTYTYCEETEARSRFCSVFRALRREECAARVYFGTLGGSPSNEVYVSEMQREQRLKLSQCCTCTWAWEKRAMPALTVPRLVPL